MSYFDQGVVFGADTRMPGVGVSPSAPGRMGLGGPNVPYIQWAPTGTGDGAQMNPVQNFLRNGVPTAARTAATIAARAGAASGAKPVTYPRSA